MAAGYQRTCSEVEGLQPIGTEADCIAAANYLGIVVSVSSSLAMIKEGKLIQTHHFLSRWSSVGPRGREK